MTLELPITVIIPTLNEEKNLEVCLESLKGLVSHIIVADSQSKDRTIDIARQYGCEIQRLSYVHGRIIPWIYKWVLDNAIINNEWIMFLEADHVVTPELAEDLRTLFSGEMDIEGVYFLRKKFFRRKWIKWGGCGNKYMLKLFRKGRGEIDPDEEDTRVHVSGRTVQLKGGLEEKNQKEEDILFFLQKHVRYIDAFAQEEFRRKQNGITFKAKGHLLGTPDQRVILQKRIYYKMPLYFRTFLYFIYRYVFLLGFLDGKEGMIYHYLQAFWFRFAVDVRLEELMRKDSNTS